MFSGAVCSAGGMLTRVERPQCPVLPPAARMASSFCTIHTYFRVLDEALAAPILKDFVEQTKAQLEHFGILQIL